MEPATPNPRRAPLAESLRSLPEVTAPAQVASRVLAEVEARRSLDTKLRALPPLHAPDSLAAGVLAAIERRQRPAWWQQSWFLWPAAARAASAPLAVAVLAVVGWLAAGALQSATAGTTGTAGWFAQTSAGEFLAVLARALAAIARSDFALILFAGGMLLSTVYVSALTLGALCWRLARLRR
ncbi:MAG: hypothetical protein FJ386_07445 [Verrucomicrobia bacterium]|nr:hypothetical protein [Verrucomicrobiota bacterium]